LVNVLSVVPLVSSDETSNTDGAPGWK